ncbi:hypothetical protein [Spiroplasma endosymbiont of Ammophila pubescens]
MKQTAKKLTQSIIKSKKTFSIEVMDKLGCFYLLQIDENHNSR